MNTMCKFAILRYVPDEMRQEFVNIGVVLHSPADGHIDFKVTEKFNRVKAFDDEVNIKFMKIVIEGIQDEFTKNEITSGPQFEELYDELFLEKKSFNYSNQFQFSPTRKINLPIKDHEHYHNQFRYLLEQLYRTYVYYDSPKSKRITPDEVNKIMSNVLKTNHTEYRSDFKLKINDVPENIDFIIKTNNKIKILKTFSFDFQSNNIHHAFSQARVWAWNYQQIKNDERFFKRYFSKHFNELDVLEYELSTLVYLGEKSEELKGALRALEAEAKLETVSQTKEIEAYAERLSFQAVIN